MRPVASQGEVWDAVMGPAVGREQDGFRPVIVVSADEFNAGPRELALVVPITSRHVTTGDVAINPPEGGLESQSWALPYQVRSVSHRRLKRLRGSVSDETLRSVHAVLGVLMRVD
jgi:mRNA interferase MazF